MTKIENFKNSMYDYANIIEYFSYYGNVIYVSTSYYLNEDYFIVVQTPKEMAVINITAALHDSFASIKNRDELIADLQGLESHIHWVVPRGFHTYVSNILNGGAFPDKDELIKLKTNDISMWNKIFVENALRTFKQNNTLMSHGMRFDQNVRNGYTSTFLTVDALYDNKFHFVFDSVVGNPFFDIKIKYFADTKTRRLLYFDLGELAELLTVLAKKNEVDSLNAVSKFISNA